MSAFHIFEANGRIYVTSGKPGDEAAPCVARPANAGRGHPKYTIVTRSIPNNASVMKKPVKTVKDLLAKLNKSPKAE